MFICDSHLHTRNSFDAVDSLDDVCVSAIAKGINEIVVTEHCDLDSILLGLYPKYDEASIYRDINAARQRFEGHITVSHGIELGQAHVCPEKSRDLISRFEYDFVLGSLHNLKDVPDFAFLKYEMMPLELCEDLFKRSLKELMAIVNTGLINSLAHITYPIRYMTLAGCKIDLVKFVPQFKELFKLMIDNGVALEINTSGLRQGIGTTLPSKDLLSLYVECGGKMVTVGSDAHKKDDVGSDIISAYNMLLDVGIDCITVFHNRKPQLVKIEMEK